MMADFVQSGIFLEDKGATFALHYRNASDQEAAKERILQTIKTLEPPPRWISGKFVENIVPVDAPHKGDALLQLMSHTGCSRAIYVGDDVTDEDVFNLRDDRIFDVKIGAGTGSAARYYLRDIDEVASFIELIIGGISGQGGS
jgi:trehalose 6-phosphate phosphatase